MITVPGVVVSSTILNSSPTLKNLLNPVPSPVTILEPLVTLTVPLPPTRPERFALIRACVPDCCDDRETAVPDSAFALVSASLIYSSSRAIMK